jgi:hypothetical protein
LLFHFLSLFICRTTKNGESRESAAARRELSSERFFFSVSVDRIIYTATRFNLVVCLLLELVPPLVNIQIRADCRMDMVIFDGLVSLLLD